MNIIRTKENEVYLYELQHTEDMVSGKMSLQLLIRCHAKDFDENDIEQVIKFIHDEIFECSRGMKHKLECYGLYDALYYGCGYSDMTTLEKVSKLVIKGQNEFISWLFKKEF